MSIYRTLARMAAVCSLNNFMEEPWPTLAGPHIFDSKIEPVEDMKTDRALPCVVVYTDYDKDFWTKSGKTHDTRLMSLTFELLVVQKADDARDRNGEPVFRLECPEADSEIEVTLDVLEAQIFRALEKGSVASDCFNMIASSYHNTISRRGASVEGGLRLAARQITLEMNATRHSYNHVPPWLEPFLCRLEDFDDYKDMVPDLRDMLTANASVDASTKTMRMFGYASSLMDRLGAPTSPAHVLPPEITYHLTGLSP